MSTTATAMRRPPSSSGLYDVLDLILDKGLVIDAYVRVSLVGIEVLTIDARIVIASVDTYLRFAEAADRLNLQAQGKDITDLTSSLGDGGKSGAVEGAKNALPGGKRKDDEQESDDREPEPASAGRR